MNHWVRYHSQNVMDHSYASIGSSRAYVKTNQPRVNLRDYVWVVEGDKSKPVNFELADCFTVTRIVPPPYPSPYEIFKFHVEGVSMFSSPSIPLNKKMTWFDLLHGKYITKQKLFACINEETDILNGLSAATGIKI